ncbi:MAG: oligosaccharide repeat unit polymerase [Deltaproteobacteria bacterium]|nr:oligosaccharide repeat unit polymerase [Deltaproteobacteria bacterium]
MKDRSYQLRPWLRFSVCTIFAFSLFDCFFIALDHASFIYWKLFLLRLLHIALLLYPFIFYRQNYVWFHPLVFNTLISAIRLFFLYLLQAISGEGLSLLIFENDALPFLNEEQIAALMAEEQLLLAISLFSYYLAYFYFPPLSKAKFLTIRKSFDLKAVLLVLLSLLVFTIFIGLSGGIGAHIASWQGGRKSALTGIGYLAMLTYAAAVSCLIWWSLDNRAGKKVIYWLSLIVSLLLMLLLGGSRSYIINIVVIGFLLWIYNRQRFSKFGFALTLTLIMFFVGCWGAARTQLQKQAAFDWDKVLSAQSMLVETQKELILRSSVRKAVYPILHYVPSQDGYLYGRSYLAAFLCWIPRQFWPEKFGLIDGLVGETFFDVNVGIPPGPIGEAYWNFGYLGVVLAFALYGCFHKSVYSLFQTSDRSTLIFLLYMLLLFNVYPITSSIISALLLFVPGLLICWLFTLVQRR